MEFVAGLCLGLLAGFYLAAQAFRMIERDSAKQGVIKLDDKLYKVTEIKP